MKKINAKDLSFGEYRRRVRAKSRGRIEENRVYADDFGTSTTLSVDGNAIF